MSEPLPETLPADPLPLLAQWLEEARPVMKSPTAMALATVGADGRPTVRMVICRGFDVGLGWLVFYSDRESTKGLALAANPRAFSLTRNGCTESHHASNRPLRSFTTSGCRAARSFVSP